MSDTIAAVVSSLSERGLRLPLLLSSPSGELLLVPSQAHPSSSTNPVRGPRSTVPNADRARAAKLVSSVCPWLAPDFMPSVLAVQRARTVWPTANTRPCFSPARGWGVVMTEDVRACNGGYVGGWQRLWRKDYKRRERTLCSVYALCGTLTSFAYLQTRDPFCSVSVVEQHVVQGLEGSHSNSTPSPVRLTALDLVLPAASFFPWFDGCHSSCRSLSGISSGISSDCSCRSLPLCAG